MEFLRQSLCHVLPQPAHAIPSERVVRRQSADTLSTHGSDVRLLGELSASEVDMIFNKRQHPNARVHQTAPLRPEISLGDRFYENLRKTLDCGDVFAECTTSEDCNSREVCIPYGDFSGYCAPSVSHCLNVGCDLTANCNMETGECETTLNPCTSDDDCGTGHVCMEIDDKEVCVKEDGFCRSDSDCRSYKDSDGEIKNKCDVKTNECVECLPREKHVCGDPKFGKDPEYPYCDPLGTSCFPQCDIQLDNENFIDNYCCEPSHIELYLPTCCDFGEKVGDAIGNEKEDQINMLKVNKCVSGSMDTYSLFAPKLWEKTEIFERACRATLHEGDKKYVLDEQLAALGYDEFYRCQLNKANNWGDGSGLVEGGRRCDIEWGGRGNLFNDINNDNYMFSQCPPTRPNCNFDGICEY